MSNSEIHEMEERLIDRKVQEELKVLKRGKLPVEQMVDGLNEIIHELTPKCPLRASERNFLMMNV